MEHAGAVLTIDLGAIAANWRDLAARTSPAACAAVVKADAYGLGATQVAPALLRAGCRHFFVAHLDEGIELRAALGGGPEIFVLHGPPPGAGAAFAAHGLVPVLNSAGQVAAWGGGPAALQVDTGMARLGLSSSGLPEWAAAAQMRLVMSHLACADDPAHPANERQCHAFARLRARFPGVPASLAASSGIFLGPDYHFDLVRPGAALYGVAPGPGPNPMRPVLRLSAPIVQVRDVGAGEAAGYGQTWRADKAGRLAVVAAGYADGLPRSLSGRGCAWLGPYPLPFAGRVSMDLTTLDASAVPEAALRPGAAVDLIGPRCPLDDVAARAGTIGYEILTSLGRRYQRRYLGG